MTIHIGPSVPLHLKISRFTVAKPTSLQRAVLHEPCNKWTISTPSRHSSSRISPKPAEEHTQASLGSIKNGSTPISEVARQIQADREFFTNLISSAATKRDAKAYINRLKGPSMVKPTRKRAPVPRPQVNLGGLFPTARAVEQSPVFSQHELETTVFKEQETFHVALVKISDLEQVPDNLIVGIAETLCQLGRLSMSPCIVLESSSDAQDQRQYLRLQADRLATAIDVMGTHGARIVEDIFTVTETGQTNVKMTELLLAPLRRGVIPVIIPSAFTEQQQSFTAIPANDALIALTKHFAFINARQSHDQADMPSRRISLDRVIVVDHAGGIPKMAADDTHVFLNLEQEYMPISRQLTQSRHKNSGRHLRNLDLFRQVLAELPHSASGLLTTPEQAANISLLEQDSNPSSVGTRRSKNTLVYNLLTDKPSYSSSLPKTRLTKRPGTTAPLPVATFIKHGMPLTILPDPAMQPWTPDGPRIKLTDPHIDLERLVYLIDDSFNRKLDVESYLNRVNERIAGVIIAGDYEGGAILTWEPPSGVDERDTDRLVPYLDKFAVLKKIQGAGGVADVVFNAMVRTCFPEGVCWRSRKDNPVNKWYFERSRGTFKIPDMNWTMFWTTPGVAEDSKRFRDYETVCRGVIPTWIDKKIAAD